MKHLSALLIFLVPVCVTAQSLILNPGFEDSLQCPSGSGAFVNFVANWTKPSYGSADYFYAGCPVAPNDEPPYQGNAYGGIIVYDPANIREYMTGHLSAPLVAGTTYYVSFYVCLNSSCMEAINEIGAYFTSTNLQQANANPILLTPQIEGTSPYTSINGWQLVSGSFVATGGEQYMIIGCFQPDSLMTRTQVNTVGWGDIYYYVDEVCVKADNNGCTLGMENATNENSSSVYPVPATSAVRISFANPNQEVFVLNVFNGNGQQVKSQGGIVTTFADLERGDLAEGIYFWQLQSADRVISGRLIFE